MLRAFIAILLFAAAAAGLSYADHRQDRSYWSCSTRPLTKSAGRSSPFITRLMAGGCRRSR